MTRIHGARIDLVEVPLRVPLATGSRLWATRRLGLVRLDGGDGLEGVGEAALSRLDGMVGPMCERLRAHLVGLDAEDEAELGERLRCLEGWPEIGRALRSAVETACVDLAARAGGMSIAASLVSRPRADVLLNGLVGMGEPGRVAVEAERLVAAGFRCLKLKGGREPVASLAARVGAVRASVGPSVGLRLDLNGAWAEQGGAIEAIEAMAPFDLEYVEQPLSPELGPGALAALRHAVDVPIAADESAADPAAVRELLEADAADVVVVKPARVGGLRQARRIVECATAHGVTVVVSTLFETGIGLAAALHLAATIPGEERAHGLSTGGLLVSDLLADPLAIVNGRMSLPSGPGLGVRLDPVALEGFRA